MERYAERYKDEIMNKLIITSDEVDLISDSGYVFEITHCMYTGISISINIPNATRKASLTHTNHGYSGVDVTDYVLRMIGNFRDIVNKDIENNA